MPVYEYKGLTTEGRDVAGIVDADSARSARIKLRQSGIYPTDVVEGMGEAPPGSRPSDAGAGPAPWLSRLQAVERAGVREVSLLTRHLATLTAAKLPLMEALSAVVDQLDKGELKRIIAEVRERVKEGSSLAAALARYPSVFPEVYVNMVRAGEASGTLDAMLLRLADYLEKQVRLRNQLISALAYPAFMLAIGTLILLMLMTFIVPRITLIFEDVHQALPWPTLVLISITHFLNHYWWALLAAGIAAVIGVRRYVGTPGGRMRYDRFILGLPVIGRIQLLVSVSRFTRTLSTLLAGGVGLLSALEVVKNVVQNSVLAEAIDRARQNIGEGESLAEPLRKSGIFPPLVTHMIAVGEKSGELEPMLIRVAEAYDNEVEATVGTLTALLTPVMILAMGAIVAFIVFAILLPIFELSQAVR